MGYLISVDLCRGGVAPKWNARLDGKRYPIERSADGIVSLRLPARRHELQLDFQLDGWDGGGRDSFSDHAVDRRTHISLPVEVEVVRGLGCV